MTPLKLLIQSLKEEVVEDTVHNFHEYWYDFVFNYLSDENKDILRKISNVERLEDVDYSELPLKIKKRFTDWSVEKGIIRYAEYEDGTTLPSWYYMSIQSGIKNDWVIHFSDHVFLMGCQVHINCAAPLPCLFLMKDSVPITLIKQDIILAFH